jgi:hypothetical protein
MGDKCNMKKNCLISYKTKITEMALKTISNTSGEKILIVTILTVEVIL